MLARCAEQWERDLAVLVWGVAGTCIGGLLSLLARETTVQPMHVLISRLHLRDESAHGSIVIEVVHRLYAQMNSAQRDTVRRRLLPALRPSPRRITPCCEIELAEAGIPGVEDILHDIKKTPAGERLVLDVSGARRMIAELGPLNDIEFDFGSHRPPRAASRP